MRWIETDDRRDPARNLALEEWCVRNLDPDPGYLLLYVNDPAVVVGKNQNVHREVDLAWTRAHGVPVLRRISGGGAVYHDPGNLNFSVLRPFRPGTKLDFDAYLEPVARALRSLGVPAERTARNDLTVGGRKISGNAQFTTVRSMFSHGTLLFDADLDAVRASLAASGEGIETRAVASRRSPVTNVRPHLPRPIDLETFRERFARAMLEGSTDPGPVRLDDDAWSEIDRLADRRYRTWEWTFGRAPRFTIRRTLDPVPGAPVVTLEVEHGVVTAARVAVGGDRRRLGHVLAHLTGARYERTALRAALDRAGVDPALDGGDAAALAAVLHP